MVGAPHREGRTPAVTAIAEATPEPCYLRAVAETTAITTEMEKELDPMTEYIIKLDCGDKDDELPGWIYQEVRDHDHRYDCDGHIYIDGTWGGLVCKKCGR